MASEESEDDDDDRPQVIVYDDKSEPRRPGSRLARSEDSESEEEENSDAGIEYLEVRQKSGRKFLDNLRSLYERRVQEALDLADQIR